MPIWEAIRDVLWGAPTLILLLGFGLYFTVKLRTWRAGFTLTAFSKTFFAPRKKGRGNNLSSLSALATALGGTVGVGSISGVALAISTGGAGSVFWMWVCSFLGMALKYAEVAVVHKNRKSTNRGFFGGAMYCLEEIGYKKAAAVFAALCVLSAVAGGSVVQANAVGQVLSTCTENILLRCGIVGGITLLIIFGGRKRIGAVNGVLLPAVSALFIISSLAILVRYGANLPSTFAQIFGEAFGLRQAAGGAGGALMLKIGCTRGTFSHEAGMGSSPISYAASEERDPHVQGLWGVTEVFIDSFIVSTLTALALLCSGYGSPTDMFRACFGDIGGGFYGVALGLFAFAAIISWCFYGEEAVLFLAPTRPFLIGCFRVAVSIGAMVGVLMPTGSSFAMADIWGAFMLFPNLFLLFKSRSDVIELAKQNPA